MAYLTIQTRRRVSIAAAAVTLAVAGLPLRVHAQDSTAVPEARRSDVESMDAILHALYDVISGPAGPRDWQRFRSLFISGARLIPTRVDSAGHVRTVVMSPDEFAQRAGRNFSQHSFYESQIAKTVDTFGAVTQVFSAYASRHEANDPTPFARGINSIQLFNDGTRWWVVTIYWQAEHPGLTIPEKYLKG